MIDPEVVRLRRLRLAALRARAFARAFGATRADSKDATFARLAHASWRIARAVTGRLKAHPYASYQRDPNALVLAAYGALAWLTARLGMRRTTALGLCLAQIRPLARQLDDTRALTWLADLSDTFGRSQSELRVLLHALAYETRSEAVPVPSTPRAAVTGDRRHGELPAIEGEWPYLAF